MKKIVFILMIGLFAANTASAQAKKLGHINSQELVNLMPEAAAAQDSLKRVSQLLQGEFERKSEELKKLAEEFEANKGNMSPLIKESKINELNDKQNRLTEFERNANQEIAKVEQDLFKPISDKALKAIEDVAKEKGYQYIFDKARGGLLYAGETDDVLPFVKTKLGLK
ncbi:MAG: OmpH family outer membrane protein [Bacteroidia bacterium]